jgi:hypothetical protein
MNFIEKQLKQDAQQFDHEALANIAKVNSKITTNLIQTVKPKPYRFSLPKPFLLIAATTAAIAIMITVNLDNNIQPIHHQQEFASKLKSVESYTTMLVSSRLDHALVENLQKEKQALSNDLESIKKLFVL